MKKTIQIQVDNPTDFVIGTRLEVIERTGKNVILKLRQHRKRVDMKQWKKRLRSHSRLVDFANYVPVKREELYEE